MSGSLHYARIPRELWRERLIDVKRAGINTIQTCVFWNAHEPQSGVFDFSDNLDLDAVLGKLTLGKTTYYVLYGCSGQAGEVAIQYKNAPKTSPASVWNWDAKTKVARATFTYPAGDTITELPLESGDGASATFLVVNTVLANRTWITDHAIFVGAANVTENLSGRCAACRRQGYDLLIPGQKGNR